MAQGKMKVKTKVPAGAKSGKSEASLRKLAVKPLRKGSRAINPKKKNLKELHCMKKNIDKLIKKTIEQSTMEKASVSEPHSLKLIK